MRIGRGGFNGIVQKQLETQIGKYDQGSTKEELNNCSYFVKQMQMSEASFNF